MIIGPSHLFSGVHPEGKPESPVTIARSMQSAPAPWAERELRLVESMRQNLIFAEDWAVPPSNAFSFSGEPGIVHLESIGPTFETDALLPALWRPSPDDLKTLADNLALQKGNDILSDDNIRKAAQNLDSPSPDLTGLLEFLDALKTGTAE